MNQGKLQWVAFLFDGDDVLFPESNPLFVKRAADVDSRAEEVGDWWESFDESMSGIHFLLLKCDGGLKANFGNRLKDGKVSAEEDTFLDDQLDDWTQEFGGNGVVFLHWHNDWETSCKKTKALQAILASRYPSVFFRCVSSQMPTTEYGRVFDTRNPVVPVADFDRWFEMFEVYWSSGANGVNEQYTKDTFPCHKKPAASSKTPQASSTAAKNSASSAGQGSTCGDAPKQKERAKQLSLRRFAKIADWLPKAKKMSLGLSKFIVGLVTGLLALEPLLAVKRYLPVEAFHELTSKAKVAMLLLVFLFAIFATCVWGSLFRVLTGNSAKTDRD